MQPIRGGDDKDNAPLAPPDLDMRADTSNTIAKSSSRLPTVASAPDGRADISYNLLRT